MHECYTYIDPCVGFALNSEFLLNRLSQHHLAILRSNCFAEPKSCSKRTPVGTDDFCPNRCSARSKCHGRTIRFCYYGLRPIVMIEKY